MLKIVGLGELKLKVLLIIRRFENLVNVKLLREKSASGLILGM